MGAYAYYLHLRQIAGLRDILTSIKDDMTHEDYVAYRRRLLDFVQSLTDRSDIARDAL